MPSRVKSAKEKNNTRIAQQARQAAHNRLRDAHSAEWFGYYNEERLDRGLPEVRASAEDRIRALRAQLLALGVEPEA